MAMRSGQYRLNRIMDPLAGRTLSVREPDPGQRSFPEAFLGRTGYKSRSARIEKAPDELLKKENLAILFRNLAAAESMRREKQAFWRLSIPAEKRKEHDPVMLRLISVMADILSDHTANGEKLFYSAIEEKGRKELRDAVLDRIRSSRPEVFLTESGIEKNAKRYEEEGAFYIFCRRLSDSGETGLPLDGELAAKLERLGEQTLHYRLKKLRYTDPYYAEHTAEELSVQWHAWEAPVRRNCGRLLFTDTALSADPAVLPALPFVRSQDPFIRSQEEKVRRAAFLRDPAERLRRGEELVEELEREAYILALPEEEPLLSIRKQVLLPWAEANEDAFIAGEPVMEKLDHLAGPAFHGLCEYELMEMVIDLATDRDGKPFADESFYLDAYRTYTFAAYRSLRNALYSFPEPDVFGGKRHRVLSGFGIFCETKPAELLIRNDGQKLSWIEDFDLLYSVLLSTEEGSPKIPEELRRRALAGLPDEEGGGRISSQEQFYRNELMDGFVKSIIPGV